MVSGFLKTMASRAWWLWTLGAIGALVLAAVSGGVFWTSLRMEQARYGVEQARSRSLEAIIAATQLEALIIDRQRMARGYVISKGGVDSAAEIEGQAETAALSLKGMVSNDADQSVRAARLAEMVSQQMARIERMRSSVAAGKVFEAAGAVMSGDDEESIRQARGIVREMISAERVSLARSRARSMDIESETEIYTYAIGFIGLLVIVVAGTAVLVSVSSSWRSGMAEMQRRLDMDEVASAQLMRLAHEATGAGTWHVGEENGTSWSKEMHLLYGRDHALGAPSDAEWIDMIHPEDRDKCPWTSGAIALGGSFERTFRVSTPSGSWRHVVSRGYAYRRDGSSRMVGMDVDVTEHIENRDELRRLNDLLMKEAASDRHDREIVFDATGDMMALLEADLVIASANPAWKSALGHDPYDILGRRITDLLVDPSCWGREGSFDCRMSSQDGSEREVEWSVSATADGRIVAAGRDVTAQRLADARLRTAEDAVRQMQKIETVGEMTGGVAHDINNMLTPIVGYLDLLQHRHKGDPKSSRMINLAMQSADKAKTLVSKLLSFARRQQLDYRVVDAVELVEGMGELMAKAVAGASVEVDIESDEGVSCIRVDPNQFEMVLMNLAVNARDAMPQGGRIAVAVRRVAADAAVSAHQGVAPGDYVVVSVRDTGMGMDAQTLSRAIEPFYSTKGMGKGTGLGLSMAHGMAAQSGGVLSLASEVGKGTVASIWLPQVSDEMLSPSIGREEVSSSKADRPLRIVLVDDEDLVRASIEAMLTDLGHHVVTASSGAQALSIIAASDDVDVLVTDYLMPSMTGGELVVKAREIHAGLPAVIVSGYTKVSDHDSVADIVRVAKPFTSARLQVAMEKAVPAPTPTATSGSVLEFKARG
jgi:signal transduction histidine kinase/CHASE3 domain sensor protein